MQNGQEGLEKGCCSEKNVFVALHVKMSPCGNHMCTEGEAFRFCSARSFNSGRSPYFSPIEIQSCIVL